MTPILPPHLDPTIGDDAADNGEHRIYCDRCDDLVTSDNECISAGVDPALPRCSRCCTCDDCAEQACSDQHTPGIRQWFAA